MDRNRIVIAEFIRERGTRGELLARSTTDIPERLEGLRMAMVRLTSGFDSEVEIENTWRLKDDWVIKLAGVDSMTDAAKYRGADLWIAPEKRAKLEAGEFFETDLVDCRLVDGKTGLPMGTIVGWQRYGGPPLMEVEREGKQFLIPFHPNLCGRVDVASGVVEVFLPEGLWEL